MHDKPYIFFIPDSNAGGDVITQTTLDSWKAGKKREELKLKDVERALSLFLFNDKNGKSDSLRRAFCDAGGCALPS